MIYDITRTITPAMAVWPGDTSYSHRWLMRLDRGESVNLATITLSIHTGTHVDAPLHFLPDTPTITEVALENYIGVARVVEIDATGALAPEHFDHVDFTGVERLLIKTPGSRRGDEEWWDDYAWLSVEAAALLVEKGIRLFGTDSPSVDKVDSKTLDAHKALGRGDVLILENIQLTAVAPGDYELIALPLKLPVEGSPVRAILRTLA
jgi:arylformamidase